MLTTCYVQTILDLLGQLVTSPMKLSTLLQDANNLLRAGDIRLLGTTCNKSNEVVNLVTRCLTTSVPDLSNNWEQAMRTHSDISLTDRLVAIFCNLLQVCNNLRVFTCVELYEKDITVFINSDIQPGIRIQ